MLRQVDPERLKRFAISKTINSPVIRTIPVSTFFRLSVIALSGDPINRYRFFTLLVEFGSISIGINREADFSIVVQIRKTGTSVGVVCKTG